MTHPTLYTLMEEAGPLIRELVRYAPPQAPAVWRAAAFLPNLERALLKILDSEPESRETCEVSAITEGRT
jgi:hypothetical protein